MRVRGLALPPHTCATRNFRPECLANRFCDRGYLRGLRGNDVTDDWPTVRLDLDSRPETLTLVRGALGGVADQLALDPELLDDLKTAVSEACNNVVMHAYDDDEPGPLDVLLYARQDAIEVVIRDAGSGIDAIPAADDRLQG